MVNLEINDLTKIDYIDITTPSIKYGERSYKEHIALKSIDNSSKIILKYFDDYIDLTASPENIEYFLRKTRFNNKWLWFTYQELLLSGKRTLRKDDFELDIIRYNFTNTKITCIIRLLGEGGIRNAYSMSREFDIQFIR